MKRVMHVAALLLLMACLAHAQSAPAAAELTALLNEFLAGASSNDAAAHEKFWADDLIYTSATGARRGKAEILKSVRSAPAPKPGDPKTTYTAEDIRIQQYGPTAIVAFRLVATSERDGKSEVTHYLNSGTFIRRNNRWQVVNWQATRVPRPEEAAK